MLDLHVGYVFASQAEVDHVLDIYRTCVDISCVVCMCRFKYKCLVRDRSCVYVCFALALCFACVCVVYPHDDDIEIGRAHV